MLKIEAACVCCSIFIELEFMYLIWSSLFLFGRCLFNIFHDFLIIEVYCKILKVWVFVDVCAAVD